MEPPSASKMPAPGPPGGAARLQLNVDILSYYAISLAGLISIFIIGHWARRLAWGASRSVFLRPVTALSRTIRKISLRKLPGFTSVGHAILVTIFVALNALFSFYHVDYSKVSNLASRFGWMATGNLVFVVFLALKNTPLAILTSYSYERLNSLHQIAGYTTFLYAILHAATYTWYFMHLGKTSILREDIVTAGIVLGFAMLFTVLAGTILRRLKYELFYIVHLVLFMVIVVTLGLHRPSFDPDKTLVATVLIAALWFSDRLIRFTRLAYNSINNEATIFPLPNGGTRIVLKKPIARARAGKHCYVWLPQIRAFETHPFTIVSTEPLELIINSYSGFTRDLHEHASNKPGAPLKVSVEGPYGTFPDPMNYDKVVLVAGGSGATFAIGLAADMLRRMTLESTKQIELIWAARGHDNMAWFTRHLNHIITHECAPKIALKLHLTRVDTSEMASASVPHSPSQISTATASLPTSILEKSPETPVLSAKTSSVALHEETDVEKTDASEMVVPIDAPATTRGFGLPVLYGRPDIEASVREAIMSVPNDQRIMIAVCGPSGLVDTVRSTTASCIRVNGPAVELHCEQFGW
ncbi:ferric reductase NAD binding domain-containing protein [Xylaria telfairii]|nr:ferric reductase NAD binding domain-containing protein [Xylaria telfairii]